MTRLSGPVGIRNGSVQVSNEVADQRAIIKLLSLIGPEDGGQRGVWNPPPEPGPKKACPAELANAIRAFQNVMRLRRELKSVDAVVDPGGKTLRRLDALATPNGPVPPVPPVSIDPSVISFRQTNPEEKTAAHEVPNPVISPLSILGFLQEIPLLSRMHEYLFEMRKDNAVYWVGVAVPEGTTDFTKAQVFFHPTVVQGGTVVATEGDYATFRGGWSDSLQRYVQMQGGQLAGARQTTLIAPFMTMAAFSGKAPAYMFATRPRETLDAIMTAVRRATLPEAIGPVQLTKVGVSSFSSGIGAMRLFIKTFNDGLIVETTDFDSPFIVAEPKVITRSPGAVARVFSQVAPPRPQIGWLTMPPASFRNITSFKAQQTHAQVGWMTFFIASIGSVIP